MKEESGGLGWFKYLMDLRKIKRAGGLDHVVFLQLPRDSRITMGIQASSCVGPGKSNHPFELQGKARGCA